VLAGALARRQHVHLWSAKLVPPVVFAVVAGTAAWFALQAWDPVGRIGDLAALVVLGGGAAGVCLLASRQVGLLGPRPGERVEVSA
jgi:hypothetical protein